MSVFGRYNLMFFLAWSVFSLGVAQQHIIDSLRMRVRNAPNDSIKGVFQCKIGKEFWYINADSSSFYTNAAKEIAVTKNINGLLPYCFNNYGVLEYLQGNYSNALKNYFEGLKFANSNLVMK
jgi:hypothetical protein